MTNMNNTDKLVSSLYRHSSDYYEGRTQDFEQVFKDCLAAADKLASCVNTKTTATDLVSAGWQKESYPDKLCELKVDRKDSLQELVYHLTANGYKVDTAVVWKEFPNTGIDYWTIAIFNREEKK